MPTRGFERSYATVPETARGGYLRIIAALWIVVPVEIDSSRGRLSLLALSEANVVVGRSAG